MDCAKSIPQTDGKSNCQKLYEYYLKNPTADNAQIMTDLNWSRAAVSRYRYRLKKYGYIDYELSPAGKVCAVEILREYSPEDEPEETVGFKQNTYRQIAAACLERINDPATTISQTIELIRELRMVLKEVM